MEYDFGTVLKNLDGSDAVDNGTPQTALKGLLTALIADKPDTTVEDKAKRFGLFVKLKTGSSSLVAEDLAILKRAIEIYPTLVYGQLNAFLDQTTTF